MKEAVNAGRGAAAAARDNRHFGVGSSSSQIVLRPNPNSSSQLPPPPLLLLHVRDEGMLLLLLLPCQGSDFMDGCGAFPGRGLSTTVWSRVMLLKTEFPRESSTANKTRGGWLSCTRIQWPGRKRKKEMVLETRLFPMRLFLSSWAAAAAAEIMAAATFSSNESLRGSSSSTQQRLRNG